MKEINLLIIFMAWQKKKKGKKKNHFNATQPEANPIQCMNVPVGNPTQVVKSLKGQNDLKHNPTPSHLHDRLLGLVVFQSTNY